MVLCFTRLTLEQAVWVQLSFQQQCECSGKGCLSSIDWRPMQGVVCLLPQAS